MLVLNIKEFKKKTLKKKIICFDYGKKNIGVAVSDENQKISFPVKTVKKKKNFLNDLKSVILEFNIGGILVGIPINHNTIMSQSIKDITKNLDNFLVKNKILLPIFFWDESFTSIEAEDMTRELFNNKKKQKKYLDKFAAKVILDDYLNFDINYE